MSLNGLVESVQILLPKKTLGKEVKLRIIMISTHIEYGSF